MSEEQAYSRRGFLGVIGMSIVVGGLAINRFTTPAMSRPSSHSRIEGSLASIGMATDWINSEPLTSAGLRGKVVLINFCTYTCINWLRSLPYVRAWASKYKNNGLVVIGVHTPEFPFEQKLGNVRRAIQEMKIEYPVAVDNEYEIWNAFNNNYWPASYFVDAKGNIQHRQFGEGQYEQSELIIQQLLSKSGVKSIDQELVAVNSVGAEAAPDWGNLKSPENYLGYDRTENFSSPGNNVLARSQIYTFPQRLKLNEWALSGNWTFNRRAIILKKAGGKIACRFHARDLHLVMGPSGQKTSKRFSVLIDRATPETAQGADLDAQGNGKVTEQRLYQLIRQQGPIVDRLFEIEFLDSDVEAFAFAFG